MRPIHLKGTRPHRCLEVVFTSHAHKGLNSDRKGGWEGSLSVSQESSCLWSGANSYKWHWGSDRPGGGKSCCVICPQTSRQVPAEYSGPADWRRASQCVTCRDRERGAEEANVTLFSSWCTEETDTITETLLTAAPPGQKDADESKAERDTTLSHAAPAITNVAGSDMKKRRISFYLHVPAPEPLGAAEIKKTLWTGDLRITLLLFCLQMNLFGRRVCPKRHEAWMSLFLAQHKSHRQ